MNAVGAATRMRPGPDLERCRCGLPLVEDLEYRRDAAHVNSGRRMFRCLVGHTLYYEPPAEKPKSRAGIRLSEVYLPRGRRCLACDQIFALKNRKVRICPTCRKKGQCASCLKWGGFHRPSCRYLT